MSEFDLIDKYFFQQVTQRKDVVLGIGDDCALLCMPAKAQLAVSTDTLVSGVHFFADVDPRALGHKALAVNISDLAAMGATPAWVSLAITLPELDEAWLSEFAQGFLALAEYYGMQLVGGDTTKGPLSITVTVHGHVPEGTALTRHQAKAGDWIYVSGQPGEASLGLLLLQGLAANGLSKDTQQHCIDRLQQPTPRVVIGTALRGLASACIDISDGLAQDLGHILTASHCGADIHLEKLPLNIDIVNALSFEAACQRCLAGGDDYELLFTVPEEQKSQIEVIAGNAGVPLTCIGRLVAGKPELTLKLDNQNYQLPLAGWDHFSDKK
ncbi:thiamine-phosphate kinase [Motilimonas sp. 1_MG-2023]|uniref:thiamine-phosphate kinase n=1 Tax=Motilimonas sp. 1_MG-2023 TaxID=3062672 RepID=UPI0026E30435|nr:thiamine-phosphate kinase [Motilimonas sp. 1_MG-2023]MDO6525624.1 thiamine-phosphate kinase [Motilimonas sp. 1_MG-2023]